MQVPQALPPNQPSSVSIPSPHTKARRSVGLGARAANIRLERAYWAALKDIARDRDMTLAALVASVDGERSRDCSLAGALRVFCLQHFREVALNKE